MFVRDYLHITWDGSDIQNDIATASVHGVATSPVTGTTPAITTVPLDTTVLGNKFMDEITPNGTAQAAFTDDASKTDGLSVATTGAGTATYKVVFLAFPLEAYGTAAQKVDLLTRTKNFFGP